jgi:hypothetical protein
MARVLRTRLRATEISSSDIISGILGRAADVALSAKAYKWLAPLLILKERRLMFHGRARRANVKISFLLHERRRCS